MRERFSMFWMRALRRTLEAVVNRSGPQTRLLLENAGIDVARLTRPKPEAPSEVHAFASQAHRAVWPNGARQSARAAPEARER